MHLDKGVNKEIKEKLKYLKKGQTTYCHKGQVLVNVWRGTRDVQLISALHNKDCGEEKNRNDETMKKPEIIQDYNFMPGVDMAGQILRYCPCCTKSVKWTKKSMLILLHMAVLNSFILSKKYITNEIQKRKSYAFKDFILDCVQKMTEPEGGEDENYSAGCITSLTSTAPTRKPLLMKDPAERPQGRLEKHKLVHV